MGSAQYIAGRLGSENCEEQLIVYNWREVKKSSEAANGGSPALSRQVGEVGGAKNRYVILCCAAMDLRNEDELYGVS
ncbi:uncharacterized protein N7496_005554 [Penicillium cataractarum]|uniref:Uncharacterized protein n=1 Tax=Penicillium cataractarum TaxID=2100454 RepID=A0A9W9VG09_9EURO|nr:uncharacterized protein N7496_005554 [Penicillium cataractarum]KAJ5378145.1 hypothetical protein N7496_005554 [Penicillium cataractarum]